MTIRLGLTEIIHNICEIFYPNSVDRNVDIMIHRFGLDHQPVKTLEEIGQKYKLTRERIRQIEDSILNILTPLIQYGRYVKRYKLREKSIYLDDSSKEEISILISIILEENFDFLCYGESLETYDSGEINLVLECLGYKENNFQYSTIELNKGWFRKSKYDIFEKYFNVIHDALKDDNRIQYFDFIIKCNRSIKLFDEELFLLLFNKFVRYASIVTLNEIKYLELNFNKLSTVDKIERILKSDPILSVNDIFRIINKNGDKCVTLENIRSQMVADERFPPVGKSGQWQLSKDGKYRNFSILESIRQVLMKSGEPLYINDIFNKVKDIRGNTFSLKSVKTYLYTQRECFVILSDGRFALSDWIGKISDFTQRERVKQKSLTDIYKILSGFMELNEEKPLSEIVSHFKKQGYVDISIRNRISGLIKSGSFIDITPKGKRNRILKLVNLDFLEKKEMLISRKVHELIIDELVKIPNIRITKGELYILIKKRMPELKKASFYSYCSSLNYDKISTVKDGYKVYLVLTEN